MSQNLTILKHLSEGKSLTRLEAFFVYRIQNVTARINELRDKFGWNIVTTIKVDGRGAEYADYSLSDIDQRIASMAVDQGDPSFYRVTWRGYRANKYAARAAA